MPGNAPALEIVATSPSCAARAVGAGADRIEVCQALELGGLTPSPELLVKALEQSPPLGVHALLRERPGDFTYTAEELDLLVRQAQRLAFEGVQGLVIGASTAEGSLNIPGIRVLIEAGRQINSQMEITVHRAIDATPDPAHSVLELLQLPVTRVLTSGGRSTVGEGLPMIKRMVQRAEGRIEIMSGGGMKPRDVRAAYATGIAAVHFSAKIPYAQSLAVDEQQVRELRNLLDDLHY
ncbi:copper homeostasis protein CutC [Arthrobacter sp. MYb229]|uniref:copper homeostasis protein CutC n=1 Tax=unclassified Arthrobacter TaxID=235627 RepID=UPI000CFC631B|nr:MULTISPECIES: copper homeostasis protein CutC [unclassified Arthrobacter]PRA02416.1 copper homeostasis protein CutC [Arthrobacter sp. MYb229]PRB50641.1 copper homeostasis protein CutC [Arthrobacter sp. MYb216]